MRILSLTGLVLALGAAFGVGWLVRDASSDGSGDPAGGAPQRGSRADGDGRPAGAAGSLGAASAAPRATRVPAGDAPRADAPVAGDAVARAALPSDAAQRDASAREGRARAPASGTSNGFAAAISEALAKRGTGAPPLLDGELDAAAAEAAQRLDSYRSGLATAPATYANALAWELAERAALRARLGAMEGEAEIVLQARGGGAECRLDPSRSRGGESGTALDVATPPAGTDPGMLHRAMGVPPFGSVFVIERISVTLTTGQSPDRRSTECHVQSEFLPGSPIHPVRVGTTHAVFTGCRVWDGTLRGEHGVTARGAAAGEVRFAGRVVPAADVPRAQPMTPDLEVSDCYLRGDAEIRLQVAAAHGGGNPVTVAIDASSSPYLDAWSDSPVWSEVDDPVARSRSAAWVGGAGRIPPGHRLRIRRIDWRVRRGVEHAGTEDARINGSARMELPSLRVFDVARPSGRHGESLPREVESGTWAGDVIVNPGDERRIALTAAYHTSAQAVVYGTVEPVSGR